MTRIVRTLWCRTCGTDSAPDRGARRQRAASVQQPCSAEGQEDGAMPDKGPGSKGGGKKPKSGKGAKKAGTAEKK